MLMLLESMSWKHLPVAGGVYDQHPDFIEKMGQYMASRARQQREQQKREEAKNKPGTAGRSLRKGGRR
jgi:hypothetical protein